MRTMGPKICLVVLAVVTQACASWWQAVSSDPLAYVRSFEQGVSTFLLTSDAIVSGIEPYLGDKGPVLEKEYEDAKAAVAHAENALNDAVQAAIDAKNDSPNFAPAVADVLAACDQVVAAVKDVESAVSGSASMKPEVQATTSSYDADLRDERAGLDRYRRQ